MDYGSHAGKFMTMDTYLLIIYLKCCTIPEGERCPFRKSISDYFE